MSDPLEVLRARVLEDAETPEPVRRALSGGAALEAIHLDERGRWWHQGESFSNEKLSRLFSRSLFQTERGLWFLRIGQQSYPVTVAGTGAFAERLRVQGEAVLLSLTSGEEADASGSAWWTDGNDRLGLRLPDGRDVRLVGAAYQAALAWVREAGEGWALELPSGAVQLGTWPVAPRGRMLAAGDSQG